MKNKKRGSYIAEAVQKMPQKERYLLIVSMGSNSLARVIRT
jgi:hypothetical protein